MVDTLPNIAGGGRGDKVADIHITTFGLKFYAKYSLTYKLMNAFMVERFIHYSFVTQSFSMKINIICFVYYIAKFLTHKPNK